MIALLPQTLSITHWFVHWCDRRLISLSVSKSKSKDIVPSVIPQSYTGCVSKLP